MKDGVSENGKRNRRLMGAAAAMLIVAVCVVGRTLYLQRRGQQITMPRIRESTVPDLTPQERVQSIARARELREKWRPWALRHQAELTRMLSAKPGDQAALAAVWDAVPTVPNEPEFKAEDLTPIGVQPPSPIGFGWAGVNKITMTSQSSAKMNDEVKKTVKKGQNSGLEQVSQSFDKHRDFVIAESMTRQTEVQLWVSGRITQSGRRPRSQKAEMINKARAEGRPFTMDDMRTPYQTLEPSYDFLPPVPI